MDETYTKGANVNARNVDNKVLVSWLWAFLITTVSSESDCFHAERNIQDTQIASVTSQANIHSGTWNCSIITTNVLSQDLDRKYVIGSNNFLNPHKRGQFSVSGISDLKWGLCNKRTS